MALLDYRFQIFLDALGHPLVEVGDDSIFALSSLADSRHVLVEGHGQTRLGCRVFNLLSHDIHAGSQKLVDCPVAPDRSFLVLT